MRHPRGHHPHGEGGLPRGPSPLPGHGGHARHPLGQPRPFGGGRPLRRGHPVQRPHHRQARLLRQRRRRHPRRHRRGGVRQDRPMPGAPPRRRKGHPRHGRGKAGEMRTGRVDGHGGTVEGGVSPLRPGLSGLRSVLGPGGRAGSGEGAVARGGRRGAEPDVDRPVL